MGVAQSSAAGATALPSSGVEQGESGAGGAAVDWSWLPPCGRQAMKLIASGFRARPLKRDGLGWFEPYDDLPQGLGSRRVAAAFWAGAPGLALGVDTGARGGVLAVRSAHRVDWEDFVDGRDDGGPVIDCGLDMELRLWRWPDALDGMRGGELFGERIVALGEGDFAPVPPTVRRIVHLSGGDPVDFGNVRLSLSRRVEMCAPPVWLIEECQRLMALQEYQAAEERARQRNARRAPRPTDHPDPHPAPHSPADAPPPDPQRAKRYAEGALKGELGRISAGAGMPALSSAAERLGAFIGAGLLEDRLVRGRLITRGVGCGLGDKAAVEAAVAAAIDRGLGKAPELTRRLSRPDEGVRGRSHE